MIIKRLLATELVLAAGLGTVFLLPSVPKTSPAGISLNLPIWVGDWLGEDTGITQKEYDVLAKDTKFARKAYTSPAGDKIFVSIVLSGEDMTSSIHRPERCLPAQGWNLQQSSERAIPIRESRVLRTTRLTNSQVFKAKDGQDLAVRNLTYYWFVGDHQMTPSHLTRTMLDMRDRVLRGMNQRWAYVTVAANVTEGNSRPQRSEPETAAMIEIFIRDLAPRLQRPDNSALF